MCGIVGFVDQNQEKVADNKSSKSVSLLKAMSAQLRHRGPDDEGIWADEHFGIWLAHSRLSILDLSQAGHQPMTSLSGRFVIVFNGEIYNHLSIRKQLENEFGLLFRWRGHSDTETILAGVESWGVVKTLKKITGMFAFAIWDREEQTLILARDRMGEKPLYYGWQSGQPGHKVFLFGSEIKALKRHPAFENKIDKGALTLFIRHNYVPAPNSIYAGINKLLPGHYLILPISELNNESATPLPYWQLIDCIEDFSSDLFKGSENHAIDLIHQALLSSISDQMISDVPLGSFLSGGIDSSAVVAMMQEVSSSPVKTFTVGSFDREYNEAKHAAKVAKFLGTDHTEFYIDSKDALAIVPKLPKIYCEPFADSSQIPTYLISRLAKQSVSVVLSGDGGDEIFGGYNRYVSAGSYWKHMHKIPLPLRRVLAVGMENISPTNWERIFRVLNLLLPRRYHYRSPGEKVHKFAKVLPAVSQREFYRILTSHWLDPASIVIDGSEPITISNREKYWPKVINFQEWMMAMDTLTYMPDDVLTKVDRASMANSLEVRAPFLDHRVVELAWRMPISYKIRDGKGKWPLRQILARYIPEKIIEKPKMGFAIPLHTWLRGPLREWAETLLSEKRLREEGFFEVNRVRSIWLDHLTGKRNWQHQLWCILMFQAWLSENR